MKTQIKILSLLLAVLMLVSVFVACDDSKEEDTQGTLAAESDSGTEAESEVVTEAMPSVEQKSYNTEFYLSILDDVNFPRYYWVEESENDAMSESVFARQQKLLEWLGVELVGVGIGLNYNNYIEPFKTAVKNKDGSIDTLLSHVSTGVAGIVSEGYLRTFNDMPGINLNSGCWNLEFMDSLAISDNYYLGFNDFNILYTHVFAFNKQMMDQYSDAIETPVYDMVRNYTWTIDNMIKVVNLVYIDATADGKTTDDTFGLTGRQWVPWVGFLHACNINLVDLDESGTYKIALMNDLNKDKTASLVEKLTELSKSNSSYLDYATTSITSVPFDTGRVLMFLESTYGLVSFLDYDINFGVLPYPMWDEAQKDTSGYRHLQWGGYICIPTYLGDETMVGETLEVLSFFSDAVKVAYYEKMLGKQVADVPDDSEMLSIIWDTVCCEFAQTYCQTLGGTQLLYLMATVTEANTSTNVASTVAGLERSANTSITKFMKKVEKATGK